MTAPMPDARLAEIDALADDHTPLAQQITDARRGGAE